jgi:hypothetical protein
MPRVCRVPGFLRSSFTASELSGWPTWIDVGDSLSEREMRLAKKAKKRKAAERDRRKSVQTIPISFTFQ